MNDDTSEGQGSQDYTSDGGAPELSAGSAYFYNMTTQNATVVVNNFFASAVTINAMPNSSPYQPNVSSGFGRYQTTQPQAGQFGSANTVTVQLSQQSNITLNINVNFSPYPVTQDILIYIFYNSLVVAVASDNNAYLGRSGETIKVDPTNASQKI